MMEQDGGLGRLANEIKAGTSSGSGGLRRAGAGHFPIAAAGDVHGGKLASVEKQVKCPIDQLFSQDLIYGPWVMAIFQLACNERTQPHRAGQRCLPAALRRSKMRCTTRNQAPTTFI